MKTRLLIALTLLICWKGVRSQVQFGFNLALGASKLTIQNPDTYPDLFQADRGTLAMNFGPTLTIGIREKWSIQTGLDLSFNPSGMQFNGDTTFAIHDNFSRSFENYQNLFIEVPVSVRYHPFTRDRLINPYLELGAVYDYQLLESCPKTVKCLDHTRNHNLGAVFGFGVEFWRLSVGAKAELGLLNTITDDYQISKNSLKIFKNMQLIEIGYTFE